MLDFLKKLKTKIKKFGDKEEEANTLARRPLARPCEAKRFEFAPKQSTERNSLTNKKSIVKMKTQ